MENENKIAVFKQKQIRRTIHNNEWWFSVQDVIESLTDSKDPKQYIKKMRQRDPELNSNWGTTCTPLELIATDNKKRKVNCSNTEGLFRVVQSITSPKAEPFKSNISRLLTNYIQKTA